MESRKDKVIPIIIPSYEPDERLFTVLKDLNDNNIAPVILINDGSGPNYNNYFEKAQKDYGVVLLKHEVNCGKGRALKTAFSYCLEHYPDMMGAITIDSDGQHTVNSMLRLMNTAQDNTQLILGVRDFASAGVPKKSQWGNNITIAVFKLLYKTSISDTQTGLRYISTAFMKELLEVSGDRFEFETNMLIKAIESGYSIDEVTIETIYDSKENHQTHFNPVKDSIRIYRLFGAKFFRFLISSASSSIIDLGFFQFLCIILPDAGFVKVIGYITVATILARVISATYNYTINYYFVFKSQENHYKSAIKYFSLACVQMLCSALLVNGLYMLFKPGAEVLVKIPADVILFFISYQIQKRYVFKKTNKG